MAEAWGPDKDRNAVISPSTSDVRMLMVNVRRSEMEVVYARNCALNDAYIDFYDIWVIGPISAAQA